MVKIVKWGVAVGAMAVFCGATTEPAGDFSEPKKAVESFLTLMQKGDEAGVQAVMVVKPESKATVDLFLHVIFATQHLQKVAAERFGAPAEKYFGTSPENMLTARIKAVEDAPVKEVGESAVITIAADPTNKQIGGTVVVVKSGATWKVDGASLFGLTSMDKAAMDHQAALAAKLIPITDQAAADVAAGKYPAAADAYQDFWSKSLEAMKAVDAGPATQK